MTVERKCPTCIGLATLGEEKSMTTVFAFAGGSRPSDSSVKSSPSADATHASWRRRLRNPGPATSGGPAKGARSTGARHLRRQIARLAAQGLGQRHAAIGLIIAKLGIGRGPHRLFEGGPVNTLGQGSAKRFPQASE